MTGKFNISLTVADGDTGETKTIPNLPVLKGLDREARVKAFAEALASLFNAIDPPKEPQ